MCGAWYKRFVGALPSARKTKPRRVALTIEVTSYLSVSSTLCERRHLQIVVDDGTQTYMKIQRVITNNKYGVQ